MNDVSGGPGPEALGPSRCSTQSTSSRWLGPWPLAFGDLDVAQTGDRRGLRASPRGVAPGVEDGVAGRVDLPGRAQLSPSAWRSATPAAGQVEAEVQAESLASSGTPTHRRSTSASPASRSASGSPSSSASWPT